MAEDSDLDKTEAPSGRRIEQAREQGQVPHSRELGTFLILMAAGASFWMMGSWFAQRAMLIARKGLSIEPKYMHEPALMIPRLADMASDALVAFSPLLGLILLAAVLPPFFLNAWVFSPKALMPDLGRIDPISGFSRLLSWNSLMELGKAILKACVVGGVAAILIWKEREEILGLLAQPLDLALAHAGHMVSYSFLMLVSTLILIVAFDVPFQIWQYFDKLKMTKEEVKQETKEMMGDPLVKGRIRGLQMQAARRRMMAAVPQANVIVTNPTHYAVALSYKTGMAAPKVIAKGIGAVALKIRELGAENGVPMLEAPPLARALYKHAELDVEIPSALYSAVAEVLAYIYQLASWRDAGGSYPVPPRDLPVPPELVPEAM
ncbi:MAG: flagellar type III secretion system protein FlhB [Rhodocyclales bacterium GT-UBC]|nr:MAG: flagellar type III secretion system protein FlhB [Rhodocyclales bacterium GT-UBC]